MWIPKTATEVENAVAAGLVTEAGTGSFDAKRKLPEKGGNAEMAKDIAAMTVAGGTILYGLREPRPGEFEPDPIDLAQAAERINSVVRAHIKEPPIIEVRELETEPGKGYVLVVVPASVRAPHMVEVKGEWRFYGRGPGGNVPLTESEVARLYERRGRSHQVSTEQLVAALAAHEPDGKRVHLHVVAVPLMRDGGLRERAWPTENLSRRIKNEAVAAYRMRFQEGNADPNITTPCLRCVPTPDGVMWTTPVDHDADYAAELEVFDDGRVRLFLGRVGRRTNEDTLSLRENAVVQAVAQVAMFTGTLLSDAGYEGAVDMGVAIVGGRDAVSSLALDAARGWQLDTGATRAALPDPYKRFHQTTKAEMVGEPVVVARRLVGGFVRTIRQSDDDAPYKLQ